jgi:hypothetical protein
MTKAVQANFMDLTAVVMALAPVKAAAVIKGKHKRNGQTWIAGPNPLLSGLIILSVGAFVLVSDL